MRSFLRVLLGFREDLDLDERWWHRLAKVAAFLFFVGVTLVAGILWREGAVRRPAAGDVEVVATMSDFLLSRYNAAKGAQEIDVSEFRSIAGEDGLRKEPRFEPVYLYSADCGVATLVKDAGGVPVNPPKPLPYCTGVGDADADSIVKYRYTTAGTVKLWIMTGIVGVFWAALIAVPVLNLYYRGLVFIICGPTKKPAAART